MAQVARTELLDTLQRLLEIPAADMKVALTQACDAVAAALGADKVDAFIYDPQSDCLVAQCSSTQPLSAKERRHGLDVLQVSNGASSTFTRPARRLRRVISRTMRKSCAAFAKSCRSARKSAFRSRWAAIGAGS